MVFNCILCYLHPKIVIFQEPLETNVIGYGMPQTLNMCNSSHFDTFFPVKINKMLNFCLKLWFLGMAYYRDSYLWNWIWHALNPSYAPLKPFWCIFPSQNQQNVNFLAFSLTPSKKKRTKNLSIGTGKKCLKRLEYLHIQVCGHANCNALCQNFVWQVLFELFWFLLICYRKV